MICLRPGTAAVGPRAAVVRQAARGAQSESREPAATAGTADRRWTAKAVSLAHMWRLCLTGRTGGPASLAPVRLLTERGRPEGYRGTYRAPARVRRIASHGCQGLPGQRLGGAKRGHIRPSRLIQRHRWRLFAHSATAFWSTEGSRGLRAKRLASCRSRAGATGFDVTLPGESQPAQRQTRTQSPLTHAGPLKRPADRIPPVRIPPPCV